MKSQEETEIINEVTEIQIIIETKSQEETEIINKVTDTKQVKEKRQVIDEHTLVEAVRDNRVELGKCLVTRCEQQDSLLQERRETLFPLEADHDEVCPVAPKEIEGMSAVIGCTRSLLGYGDPGTPCDDANPQRDCPGVCG